ncbi:hypothetical protein QS257_18560 [Terrilactibacillus sp. S3-3]|nr:hypothetical protein QS257_18560 [Terrilactibacillus sp. S3-3]
MGDFRIKWRDFERQQAQNRARLKKWSELCSKWGDFGPKWSVFCSNGAALTMGSFADASSKMKGEQKK